MEKYPNGNERNRASGNRGQGAPRSAQSRGAEPRPRGQATAKGHAPRPNVPGRQKRGLGTKKTLYLTLGTVAAVLLIFMLVSFFVGVQSIEVSGTSLCTPEEIVAASGITEGSGYFSYNTARAEERILEAVPCVDEVEITRSVFGKVSIAVTEKNAFWYTELFGECFVLSDSLEVIRHTDSKAELVGRGLVRLDFPKVESAILGRRIEISDEDRDCSFIDEFLAEVRESELYKEGRLDGISIETKFEISAVSDLKYNIFLGKYSSATLKLDTARLTLTDESFEGEAKWSLDVSSLPRVVTRPDETLDFSHLVP